MPYLARSSSSGPRLSSSSAIHVTLLGVLVEPCAALIRRHQGEGPDFLRRETEILGRRVAWVAAAEPTRPVQALAGSAIRVIPDADIDAEILRVPSEATQAAREGVGVVPVSGCPVGDGVERLP